ncbi:MULTISPECIES: hypothetical protein [unclassified Bradyrhizobium]|uniref:hypothetical protein n=1 Tax=unclassified Bradyrhizobium TaxID=2631580 RepID=UPI0024799EEB|nr:MULTISPECIES: hypothetical protein [unclassified Bradyrhizobium]WGS17754.1 hypothetical protein MTX22_24365 [Bradyrhizobium sp. ISRA463]WGS24549.1 hypothetical protein MTX19_22030 [Bradyrhizobium sp. ISRA464]
MAMSDKDNTRRAHAAETARQIASGETAAFFTTLLAVLNEAEAAPRVIHHDPERPAPEPALHPAQPADPSAKEPAPPDPHLHEQHAGSADTPPAQPTAMDHADAGPSPEPDHATATTASAGTASAAHAPTSSIPAETPGTSADHASPHDAAGSHVIVSAPPTTDLAASLMQPVDTIKNLVDSSLATVSHVISDVSATIGQVTSSLSDSINHLTDGLTGMVSSVVHDSPVTTVVEPVLTDILGSTQDSSAHSPASTPSSIPLLDTAGAIPMAPLHPLPLHLGFLGQPTTDGHETHDAAFSALGIHHF